MAKKRKRQAAGTGPSNESDLPWAPPQAPQAASFSSISRSPQQEHDVTFIPCRDHANLYTPADTYRCATQSLCVPCAYKICTFDVALDTEFSRAIPNARPETCPRFDRSGSQCSTSSSARAKDGTLGFHSGMSVLTVGDGDLTYSLAVARIILGGGSTRSKSSRLVATSYESKESLLKVYRNIQDTINELESLGSTICYQVDATRLVDTLPGSVLRRKEEGDSKFHRIVWNFPCSAVSSGQDGQNDAMEFNKQLVRDFVCNATNDLLDKIDGEIHMLHKTKPPFNQWQIEAVALERLVGDNSGKTTSGNGDDKDHDERGKRLLEYKGRIVFDRCSIPPYVPRKALDRKSFTCHDACTYIFGWAAAAAAAAAVATRGDRCLHKATIACKDEASEDDMLLPVKRDMLLGIRRMHLVSTPTHKISNKKKRRRKK